VSKSPYSSRVSASISRLASALSFTPQKASALFFRASRFFTVSLLYFFAPHKASALFFHTSQDLCSNPLHLTRTLPYSFTLRKNSALLLHTSQGLCSIPSHSTRPSLHLCSILSQRTSALFLHTSQCKFQGRLSIPPLHRWTACKYTPDSGTSVRRASRRVCN